MTIPPAFRDQRFFEGQTAGWLIVTNRGKPLLHNGQIPMFWSRTVAKSHLAPWMVKSGCRIVRAGEAGTRPVPLQQTPPAHARRQHLSRETSEGLRAPGRGGIRG